MAPPGGSTSVNRNAFWLALVLAGVALSASLVVLTQAEYDDEIRRIALHTEEPETVEIGQLSYRGGVEIPPMGLGIGGLSALRWDGIRLIALTDDARWVSVAPVEEDHHLHGIEDFKIGSLLGVGGRALDSKSAGDSESLTRSANGGWLVGFERDHRVLRYDTLDGHATVTELDPQKLLGALEENNGVEAMAGNENALFACAERSHHPLTANCVTVDDQGIAREVAAHPPEEIALLDGLPTDADMASDGTTYILFRSYSPADGSGAAIISLAPDGTRRELAVLRPPFSVDNFEGLAVREEDGVTYLYIVSDDNFSSDQRTLLMKFEVLEG